MILRPKASLTPRTARAVAGAMLLAISVTVSLTGLGPDDDLITSRNWHCC